MLDFDDDPVMDYDMDGEVDAFEAAMFLNEMEEEDAAIEAGLHASDASEDYIGMDIESCTMLDPEYTGDEELDELVDRYGIALTSDDVRFFRESRGEFCGSGDDDDSYDVFDDDDGDDDF